MNQEENAPEVTRCETKSSKSSSVMSESERFKDGGACALLLLLLLLLLMTMLTPLGTQALFVLNISVGEWLQRSDRISKEILLDMSQFFNACHHAYCPFPLNGEPKSGGGAGARAGLQSKLSELCTDCCTSQNGVN